MSKSNAVRATSTVAIVAGGAPIAPVTKAPVIKQDRKIIGGDAFNRLVTAGAVLIVLASKGKLFTTVLSPLGSSVVSLQGLPERIRGLTREWGQFDRGYLVGPSASYGACAAKASSKKPKTTPAFVYAVPPTEGGLVSLMTADGQPWTRPDRAGAEQVAYDAALLSATTALAG